MINYCIYICVCVCVCVCVCTDARQHVTMKVSCTRKINTRLQRLHAEWDNLMPFWVSESVNVEMTSIKCMLTRSRRRQFAHYRPRTSKLWHICTYISCYTLTVGLNVACISASYTICVMWHAYTNYKDIGSIPSWSYRSSLLNDRQLHKLTDRQTDKQC